MSSQYIQELAKESLNTFEVIANVAAQKLGLKEASADVFAAMNTFTGTQAVNNLHGINEENRVQLQKLLSEPAACRVVVQNQQGEQSIYYISRATAIVLPSQVNAKMASYMTSVGRLASRPIGEEINIAPNGKDANYVELLERVIFHPQHHQQWDSIHNKVELQDTNAFTVESFLTTLAVIPVFNEDLADELLAEERLKNNIFEGVRRQVITQMGIRDQPILDAFQDNIFRLPLDTQLIIVGSAGTGKTTTLIRRLAQKTNKQYLDEPELTKVQKLEEQYPQINHHQSWLMFTPTELLKQYLNEAFARENVAAGTDKIKTWSDYRRYLARQVFGFLTTGGLFILKERDFDILNEIAITQPIVWFEDFNAYQQKAFLQGLIQAAEFLSKCSQPDINMLAQVLLKLLKQENELPIAACVAQLVEKMHIIQEQLNVLKTVSDTLIKKALNLRMNSDKAFIDDLGVLLQSLQKDTELNLEEDEEEEEDEDDTPPNQASSKSQAIAAFNRAIKALAKAKEQKRTLLATSKNAQIISWLTSSRLPTDVELKTLGENLLIQASLRSFVNPTKRYLSLIPKQYKRFRKERQSQDIISWYKALTINMKHIHVLELDIICLTLLKAARELTTELTIKSRLNDAKFEKLKAITEQYKNQILVDEATDFSPIQLACMFAITQPSIQSFFACGDFNQRLTYWGTRSAKDIQWVCPNIKIEKIAVSYRQSAELNTFAFKLIELNGEAVAQTELPQYAHAQKIKPVLIECVPSNSHELIEWIAMRIREIEQFVQQLPSIAILVNGEALVTTIAQSLDEELEDDNIKVMACSNGQVIGQDQHVRVFNVEHIKGLEFEAVFFVGIDELARQHPDLFDKYLYVGATRAATYLGFSCDSYLPEKVDSLRSLFGSDWSFSESIK